MKKYLKQIAVLLCLVLLLCGCSDLGQSSTQPENTTETTSVQTYPYESVPEDTTFTPTVSETSVPAETEPALSVPEDSSFEIHFLDVGQADAALILCDGQAMMIDGGNSEDSSLVYTYLKNLGIDYLDVVISTHAHEDHVGGLSGALSFASAGTVYSPVTEYNTKAFEKFKEKAEGHGAPLIIPSPGDTFVLGSAECTIIGPISDSDDPNNTSIVLRIVYGNTSFLFTGDAETIEEGEILDAGFTVDCDVLKVGHHGSETSSGYRWLRETSPSYAVISVGNGNSYGHPHESTMSRLRDADVTVYRTDMQGTIICYSDGNTVTFDVERNNDADTLSGAGAGGSHTEEAEKSTDSTASVAYVVNTNTGKFHEPSCSSVEDMSEKNRMDVNATRDELIAQGYVPCGRCDP